MLLLAAGATLTWFAGGHLAYATGLAGTSGHLRVEECVWEHVGGHRYPHCSGVFHSSDGTVVDPDASVGAHLPSGSTIAVRQTASGGYERIGLAASCGWLAVSLLGLSMLLLGVLAVCVRTGARRVPRALWVLLGSLGAAMLLSALVGGVAGMTEAF
ncbi:hypothetical protein ABZ484_18980 [Streptomyces sp. NPDC006393]|uniref:hypothetical protein n=1 Tax=Streptomyces sp. NPDC006393 TaxID=3156763 RepID=UPI0033C06564